MHERRRCKAAGDDQGIILLLKYSDSLMFLQVTDKIVDIIRRSFHRKLSSQTKYIYNYKSPEISHDSNSSAHIDPTSSVLSDGIEHRSEKSGPPPCWNVVERFRIKFAIAMVGTLWRRTRRNDSWKEITLLYMGTGKDP